MSAALLPLAEGGTLERVLAARTSIRSGEAVTVLLAVARAIADLHAAGWAGAVPDAETVAFRADGRPVLTRLDRAGPLTPGRAAADRAAFHAFARSVCGAVDDAGGVAIAAGVAAAVLSARDRTRCRRPC